MKSLSTTVKQKPPFRTWLSAIEEEFDFETVMYILVELYKIVFTAHNDNEDKEALAKRIIKFEKTLGFPEILGYFPLEQLLSELEDAQNVYPLSEVEIEFPDFEATDNKEDEKSL